VINRHVPWVVGAALSAIHDMQRVVMQLKAWVIWASVSP
jgi:hypothetical protein